VIDGTVEDHEPRGVAGDNLRQNPGGRRYLLIPAFVGYQSVQNLLPDVLFVLGGDAFLTPFLNGSKPVLESILVCLVDRDFPVNEAAIRSLTLGWIRIVAAYPSGKVVAKSKNSLVFSCD
jgi:hypothetical protein